MLPQSQSDWTFHGIKTTNGNPLMQLMSEKKQVNGIVTTKAHLLVPGIQVFKLYLDKNKSWNRSFYCDKIHHVQSKTSTLNQAQSCWLTTQYSFKCTTLYSGIGFLKK